MRISDWSSDVCSSDLRKMKRQRRRAEAARLEARYDGDAPMHQHRTSQFQGMQLETRARKIVEQLGGTWSRSRGMCCCPAHDDRTPSLSITLGKRAILVTCFRSDEHTSELQSLMRT